jgi:hypothetical protein
MGTTTVVRVIENPPDHLGAWLTFVGVFFGGIIVAIITAVTTQRRLRAQLASEERRHRDQPDFDRAETDRVELRAILESLAERLLAVYDAANSRLASAQRFVNQAAAGSSVLLEHPSTGP